MDFKKSTLFSKKETALASRTDGQTSNQRLAILESVMLEFLFLLEERERDVHIRSAATILRRELTGEAQTADAKKF